LGIEAGKLIILHDITREKAVERMKTEFVSIAAHQLRTPLSAIKWIMNMMLEGDMGNISESQREFLLKTYQSNERMIRLVNDLLNITRIEEGRFLYELVPKDITALVERTVASLQEMAKQRGVKMIVYKPNLVPPPIYIDEEKVAMAIQNLIDNAINYTPSGKEVNVFMDYDLTTDTFLFKVQDEGFGIPPEQQKRIFSRFFRAPNALKADTEGSGLGLFIAKNVVEAHHGKIWFESTEDKGSTFYFTLPRQPR
jgi:signal transduction histidine kinase